MQWKGMLWTKQLLGLGSGLMPGPKKERLSPSVWSVECVECQ